MLATHLSTEVASQFATMTANSLPVAKSRKKSQGKVVAKAAQAFQMSYEDNPVYPGYIVGHLVLPPRGIKDAESVGLCAQIFTVIKCQPGSLELAYGDPDRDEDTTENWVAAEDGHFLLSPGDAFLVPPGNTYRLQNHSKTTDCTASWVIIRHNQHAMPEDE
jgi:centromere protein C